MGYMGICNCGRHEKLRDGLCSACVDEQEERDLRAEIVRLNSHIAREPGRTSAAIALAITEQSFAATRKLAEAERTRDAAVAELQRHGDAVAKAEAARDRDVKALTRSLHAATERAEKLAAELDMQQHLIDVECRPLHAENERLREALEDLHMRAESNYPISNDTVYKVTGRALAAQTAVEDSDDE